MKQIAMKSRLVDGQASSPTLPSPFRPRGRGIALALEAPLHPEPSGKMWLIHKPNAVRPDPLPIIARDCDQPCSPDPRCARAGSSARRRPITFGAPYHFETSSWLRCAPRPPPARTRTAPPCPAQSVAPGGPQVRSGSRPRIFVFRSAKTVVIVWITLYGAPQPALACVST